MSMALFEVAELFINTLMRAEKAAGVWIINVDDHKPRASGITIR